MELNQDKLRYSFECLKQNLNNARPDSESYYILLRDFHSLLDFLKIANQKEYRRNLHGVANLPSIPYFDFYRDFFADSCECIIDNKQELVDSLNIVTQYDEKRDYLFRRLFFKNESLDFVMQFLKEFDSDFAQKCSVIASENVILKSTSNNECSARGECHYIQSLNEPFIVLNSKKYEGLSTLVHEFGHVYEYLDFKDFKTIVSYHHSAFKEAFAIFIKLAYLDYDSLINGPKRKIFVFNKLLQEMAYCAQKMPHFLDKIDMYNLNIMSLIYDGKYTFPKQLLDEIISRLIAIYMFVMYKEDIVKFKEFLNQYHSFIGKSDEEIKELFCSRVQNVSFSTNNSKKKKKEVKCC